jgi:polyribonucleotide nucleotidyltransferase
LEVNNEELYQEISKDVYKKCYDIAKKGTKKEERSKLFNELKDEIIEKYSDEDNEDEKNYLIKKYLSKVQKEAVRELVLNPRLKLIL